MRIQKICFSVYDEIAQLKELLAEFEQTGTMTQEEREAYNTGDVTPFCLEVIEELVVGFVSVTRDVPIHVYDFTEWLQTKPFSEKTVASLNVVLKKFFSTLYKSLSVLLRTEFMGEWAEVDVRLVGDVVILIVDDWMEYE